MLNGIAKATVFNYAIANKVRNGDRSVSIPGRLRFRIAPVILADARVSIGRPSERHPRHQ